MAKPPRSPLLGYNHNVKYGGHIFHIQTEDSGPANPHVFTHLFYEGSILGSKRCQYEPAAADDDVRALMQAQHKAILRELKQKAYDERITRFFASRGLVLAADEPAAAKAPAAEPQRAADLVTPAPEVAPVELPVTPAPKHAVLDLDAIPAPARPPTPEPVPIHLAKAPIPGPGTYTFRRPTREERPAEAGLTPPPMPTPEPSAPPPSLTPVVVQRQVVVGAGAPPATTTRAASTVPVRRRPVSGGPYVVKEGSHVSIPASATSASASQPAAASDPNRAPRTAEAPRAVQPTAAVATDQSLDDVILAYLSHGDAKR